jgi:hypothetical protein
MKHGHSFAIGILALALAACGGSGDGGSKSSVVGLTSTPRIEVVLTDPTLDPGYPYMDPLSIQTGDRVQFQLVNYSGTADSPTRNVISADTFATTDSLAVGGVFSPSDGVFAAASTDTGGRNYVVTARYGGQDYSTYYTVQPRQIRLHGKVLAEGTGLPVYNATIDFYGLRNPLDSSSQTVVIATVHTAVDGTYKVSIPAFNDSVTTADEANSAPKITFTVRSSALPDGYYGSFIYKSTRFDAGSTVCRPNLISGIASSDDSSVFLPFKSGERFIIDTTDADASTNGTIVLTPKSLYDTKPDPDGCSF